MKRWIITPLTESLIPHVNEANEPFWIIGHIEPSFANEMWTYEEVLYEQPIMTKFPDDDLDWTDYVNDSNRVVFLAMDGERCIGQIRVVREWNRFAYIENIAVQAAYRQHGVANALLQDAERWAKEQGLIGLSLEAQHDNVIACRFYKKMGFVLGGADTFKQYANPHIQMTLYWYNVFERGVDI